MNMSVEGGVVEGIENGWAHMSTRRKSACSGCSHQSHCHIIPGMDKVMVTARNAAQAQVGDQVEFKLSTKTQLKGLFVLYMFPVLGLLIGAFSADGLSGLIGLNEDVGLFVFILLGVAIAFLSARLVSRRMETRQELTPVVSRIVRKAKPPVLHSHRKSGDPTKRRAP